MSNDYRIVLEFVCDDLECFDRVVALEMKLEEELLSGLVDGHDAGGDIVNIFIDTKEPKQCFDEALRILNGMEPQPDAAGYRNIEDEEYVRLLPVDAQTPFELR